jgi:hypothetical protein
MNNPHFQISFSLDQTSQEVFNAIRNVRAWWSEALEGNSENIHDEFIYRHGELHYSKHKLIEVIPYEKVVWLTLESQLTFVEKQDEWNNTQVIFEISKHQDKTLLTITHFGLIPELHCFSACSNGWTHYLKSSLFPLITTGKGNPDLK